MGQWEWVHLARLHTEPLRYKAAQGLSSSLVMRGSSMRSVKGKEQMMLLLQSAGVKMGGGYLGAFDAQEFSLSRPQRARTRSAAIFASTFYVFASLARTADASIVFLAAEFVQSATLSGVLPPLENSCSLATVR